MSIRVLLVDDHAIMREGLRLLLEKMPGVEVVGEADNGYQAIELAKSFVPDVVVMDVGVLVPSIVGGGTVTSCK